MLIKKNQVKNRRHNSPDWFVSCCEYIQQYFRRTTLHGFRYIGNKNSTLIERLFWVLAICIAICLSSTLILRLINKYNKNSVILVTDTETMLISKIPFPSVTICNRNQIRQSVFSLKEKIDLPQEKLNETEKMKIAVAEILCDLQDGNIRKIEKDIFKKMVKEAVPTLKQTVEAVVNLRDPTNVLIDKFQPTFTQDGLCYTFNLIPLQHILYKNFTDVMYDLGQFKMKKIPKEMIADYDYGYRSDSSNEMPWRVKFDGEGSTTVFVLKNNKTEHQDSCTQGSKGFKIYIHSARDLPAYYHTQLHIKPNTQTEILLTPLFFYTDPIMLKWSPHERGCYFTNEKKLKYYKIYTQYNCDYECKALRELERCGCVAFFHPKKVKVKHNHILVWVSTKDSENQKGRSLLTNREGTALWTRRDIFSIVQSTVTDQNVCMYMLPIPTPDMEQGNKETPICGPKSWDCMRNVYYVQSNKYDKLNYECNCLPSCATLDYKIDYKARNFNVTKKSIYKKLTNIVNGTEYSVLNFRYKVRTVNGIKRTPVTEFTDFLANVGGILSLFLGFGFLSLFELIYYLTLRIVVNYWNRKRKNLKRKDNTNPVLVEEQIAIIYLP